INPRSSGIVITLNLKTGWLQNFRNHKTVDEYSKNALWNYWRNGNDEEEDGYCNTGDLPGFIREGSFIHCEYYEWYNTIEDSELKEEALINKRILEESMKMMEESMKMMKESSEDKKDPRKGGASYVKPPTCKTEKFEVVKYSFETAKDIFHKKNEGWLISRTK
ncbi:hypothetical protein Tco_1180946, partial [Tanacetum coccineum]